MDVVSKLTKKQYFSSSNIRKNDIHFSTSFQLNAKNADTILGHLLSDAGLARIPVGDNTFQIINARDVRYNPVPVVTSNKSSGPNIPKLSMDYFQMQYKATYPMAMDRVTRNIRPFLSRYGRIIHNDVGGFVVVQDQARNIQRVYKILKDSDVKPSKELLKKWKDQRRHHRQKELVHSKKK